MTATSGTVLDLPAVGRLFGDAATARGWDFLGNVPVSLRHRVRDGVAELVAQHGETLKCCFPMGQGGDGPFERLRRIRSFDDYPGMVVSSDHGNVFNRRFYDRHVATGGFVGCQPGGIAPVFSEAELVDPKGWIGTFAVAPFVLLIDHRKLNGLPVPRRWADLLDPVYRGQVVFSGWRRDGEQHYRQYNKFFLLSIAKEFGLEGVARLIRNVPALIHSAQMPRLAGGNASPGGIYVVPWSLADICPRRDRTEVVWPTDGALAYPLWLTVKAARRNRLGALIDYFYGEKLARYLDQNRYPALLPGREHGLPRAAQLKWLGW
ncbi:MAG TPA: ABC transporter substrate-binding protein, partial [Rhizomicrobium sp.]